MVKLCETEQSHSINDRSQSCATTVSVEIVKVSTSPNEVLYNKHCYPQVSSSSTTNRGWNPRISGYFWSIWYCTTSCKMNIDSTPLKVLQTPYLFCLLLPPRCSSNPFTNTQHSLLERIPENLYRDQFRDSLRACWYLQMFYLFHVFT